jgi:hypothetical protein
MVARENKKRLELQASDRAGKIITELCIGSARETGKWY